MPPPAYCVVAGHSHIAAFGVPIRSESNACALRDLPHPSGRFRIMTGEWPRTEGYWKEVCEAAAGNIVALFWLGNQHLSPYLFEPDHRFDFVLSSEPDLSLDETATIVPEALVRASFLPTLRGLAYLIPVLQGAGAHAVVCGTAAPCGNDIWITNEVVNDGRWFRLGRGHREDAPIGKGSPSLEEPNSGVPIDPAGIRLTPRVLRYKLWAVLQALLCETADATGATFLPSPKAAQTADGFLRDEYRRDINHANDAYGALVLEDLWQHMRANGTPV